MMPYRIRSQRVSERLRRGTSAGGLAVELIHDLKTKPHYPAEITGFGEGSLVARGLAGSQIEPPCRSSTKFLSNSIRKGYSVNDKMPLLKRFLPSLSKTQEIRRNSTESYGAGVYGHESQNKFSIHVPSCVLGLSVSELPRVGAERRPKCSGTAWLSALGTPAGDSR